MNAHSLSYRGWRVQFLAVVAIFLGFSAIELRAQTPRAAQKYLERGVARYKAGDLDGAIADFDKAIELNSHPSGTRGDERLSRFSETTGLPAAATRGAIVAD